MPLKSFGHRCTKCNLELYYYEPSISFMHCGTDYWTQKGERRLRPKICMSCRTKVGRNAQKAQALSYSQTHFKTDKGKEEVV